MARIAIVVASILIIIYITVGILYVIREIARAETVRLPPVLVAVLP